MNFIVKWAFRKAQRWFVSFLPYWILAALSVIKSGPKIERAGIADIFVERLWRSVKYEEVYPKGYETMDAAYQGLHRYFEFYNHQRPHQALDYRTPAEVYADRTLILSPTEAEGLP